ncbi:tubulin nucleotide-binding domain-like protein [Coniophora puteana RWD-64-598 SS2]|uniref:Tubulin nucleotide-binding domain-like protein n=1 Tax=Coniophora puteana (strain RWD-64-598) TaxID=741705 RepID=A0A5M3M7Z2_CONPW|nr:tubulin nucleotide-binding domain-like protein [Coniophora puteana RWD-64-598 SS2]EIW74910.1 tubulin nucleotide-binding domain-like protein [Coniophora puteana RWD-64-598 SS2]
MREIIYIQAGSFANYTGTHFWNTQESYFTYAGDDRRADSEAAEGEEPVVDHAISFKEGKDPYGQPSLCPRLLAFDFKSNFGTLSSTTNDDNDNDDTDGGLTSTWGGPIAQIKKQRVEKSAYHRMLDEEGEHETEAVANTNATSHRKMHPANDQGKAQKAQDAGEIRYWSDFNRVYFDPRTVQGIPGGLEGTEGDWDGGREVFARYNEETELMDGALRLFAEECDSLQGLQMIHDTSTFGGFTSAFLNAFRDEYPKLSILSFPVLSEVDPIAGGPSPESTRHLLSDTLSLRDLSELCDLSIPVQGASRWPNSNNPNLCFDPQRIYEASAVLSAHIETATLPLRLKQANEDISSIIAHLNWRQRVPFAELLGSLPLSEPASDKDFQKGLVNFTTAQKYSHDEYILARRDTTRGLNASARSLYETWCEPHPPPYTVSTHAPAYPLPTSFPAIIQPPSPNRRETMALACLRSAPGSARIVRDYAGFANRLWRSGAVVGIERDELREIGNELNVIGEGYEWEGYADGQDGGDGDGLGEDE